MNSSIFQIPLDGEWQATLYPEKKTPDYQTRTYKIQLPGSLPGQGIGDDIDVDTPWVGTQFDTSWYTAPEYAKWRIPGNIKVPFWLQPKKYFRGIARYEREIVIPEAWEGRRIVLTLERPHWKSTLWLDGKEIGGNDSLSTAHEYDLGTKIQPGKHLLCIGIDNTVLFDVGPNSHSITDHTQGNWNGIVGRMTLVSTEISWIDELHLIPRVASRSVMVRGRVGGAEQLPAHSSIDISCEGQSYKSMISPDGSFEAECLLGKDAELWDEFNPRLYKVTARLSNGESREATFGLREVSTEKTQITVNQRRIFLRGTLECALWPKTGHPPTDIDSWRRVLGIIKAHGLNHVRFHSWCPPEAAFAAGDELGLYFQIEVASWPNQGTTIGDGGLADAWIIKETDRIIRAYGNHPSFLLMAACNEPDGPNSTAWLSYWVERMKTADSRRLYTCSSGWPELDSNQYHISIRPRTHQWLDNLKSRLNARPPETETDYGEFIRLSQVPIVSHEIGQWCAYPNFDEIPKYTGYLKARNFEIFRETLTDHGMSHMAKEFLYASGKLQTLCYKEEIESALRTSGMGGFQLLGLSDFSGQGTALVGVLDAFWEEKGYVSAAEFKSFCSETVPLARLKRRVFSLGDSICAKVELAHYGKQALQDTQILWKIKDAETTLADGEFSIPYIPTGGLSSIGDLKINSGELGIRAASMLTLEVSVKGSCFENRWDLWVYPQDSSEATNRHDEKEPRFFETLDEKAIGILNEGGTVCLTIPPSRVRGDKARGPVALGFSSIFWNTSWSNGQAPHTLGVLCDPSHAALSKFPTQGYSNWQWWYIVMHASAMILDEMPTTLRPIIQVVDDWFTNRKLGLVFEGKAGNGRILVCSVDLNNKSNLVAGQLRTSLLKYIRSDRFSPETELSVEQIRNLYTEG